MNDNIRKTTKKIPVLFNNDQNFVMANAEIVRAPDKVTIQVVVSGPETQFLADFLEQADPFALSLSALPVQNIREKREKN